MPYSILNHSPSATYIAWSGVKILYDGVTYPVTNGNTNQKFVYWLKSAPTAFVTSMTQPVLTDDDCIVLVNNGGVATNILNSSVIDGSLIVTGTVHGTAITAETITGSQIAAHTITADEMSVTELSALNANMGTITAGNITLDATGYIRGGQTAYATGSGFWMGKSGADYKFSLGSPTIGLTWDGAALNIGSNAIISGKTAGEISQATRNVFRGDWAQPITYVVGDTVYNANSSWTCIANHTSAPTTTVLPTLPSTSNAYWQLLAGASGGGSSGNSSFTASIYKISATDPGIPTDTVSTYNFTTSVLTLNPTLVSAGWTVSQPSTTTTPTWATEYTFSGVPGTTVTKTGSWGSTRIDAVNGAAGLNGTSGTSIAVVEMYKQGSVPGSLPTLTTYTFSTGVVSTTGSLNGWSQSMPASSTVQTYVTTCRFSATAPTDTNANASWSTPVIIAQNGVTSVVGSLSNESHAVPTATDGTAGNYTGCASTMSVFEGVTNVSASWTYAVTKSAGVSCTEATTSRVQTVTAMTTDVGTVTFVASRASYPSITSVFTISKSKAGSQGITGAAGSVGTNGTRTAIMDMYQWAAVAPSTYPGGTASTYTWATGQFTNPGTLNGWTQTPGAGVAGQTLYAISQAYADTLTSATSLITWSSTTTRIVGVSGSAGLNGTRTAFLELYQWAATTPTLFPSGTSSYTWATGAFTAPTTPNAWSLTPGASTPGYTLYACSVRYSDSLTTTPSAVTWSTSTAYPVGTAGTNGTNGTTYYTWLKYADTPTTGMSDDPTGKLYMGIAANKTSATESSTYADYTWSLIQGAGIQGIQGVPGTSTYTWVKYGTSNVGAGLNDSPTGMTYIGLAFNKSTATESTVAGDYTWSLIKGDAGGLGPTISISPSRGTTFQYTDGILDAGNNASITLTANVTNLSSPTYAWVFDANFATAPTPSTTATAVITAANLGVNRSATATCTVSGLYSDKITIVRLDGSTAVAGATANDITYSATQPASIDGSIWADTSVIPNVLKVYTSGAWKSVSNITGSSTNYVNPRYCTFSEGVLPPNVVVNGTAALDTTTGIIGSAGALKLTSTAVSDNYCILTTNSATYNMPILPNKYWIASAWVKSDKASAIGQFYIRSTDGTTPSYSNAGAFVTSATIGEWTRVSAVLNLSAKVDTLSFLRIDNEAGIGYSMWFDGIMVEPQVNEITTPSEFSAPPNFLELYKGDLNATSNSVQIGTTFIGTPTANDIWTDTSVTPSVTKMWDGSAWVGAANYTTDLNQLANTPGYDNSNATLTAGTTITGGGITLSGGGAIKSSGKTWSNSTEGFYLGYTGVSGKYGLDIVGTGQFRMRSAVSNERLVIQDDVIAVFDSSGTLRVKIGNLAAVV